MITIVPGATIAAMNLDYLKTYLLLVKMGSFSAVAKKLSISQPAVSFQIQRLEQDLGIRLLNRSQKRITLTEAGKSLLSFAQTVRHEEGRLLQDIEHLRDDVGGELRVAASTAPGELIIPALVGEFISCHPAVRAQILVMGSMAVITGVHDGSYEVGICGMPPNAEYGLQSFKVSGDEIVLIVSPQHRLATRDSVSFADIEGEPFIQREAASGTQRSVESLLAKAGYSIGHLVPRLTVGSSQAVISAVEAGAGIAFVSDLAASKATNLGTVRSLTITGLNLRRGFYCIYHAECLSSRLLQEFVSFVKERVGGQ
ncbi:MAG: LysR family transcriptional regulator [Dehalococcoidia bacterium]|nr:LysR family transcriptional regulator [Dehalococcoidia bacterium]